jgi:hypothetical protein
VSGRIALYLDPGLGWTKPLAVACCGVCGTELARHPNHDRAIRAARRLPGTTSLTTDLALAGGRQERSSCRWTPARQPTPHSRHARRR